MAFIQMNMFSESLMRTVNVNVILPADKLHFPGEPETDPRPFRTLYLLHGVFGSQVDWVNGTNIQRYAEEKDLCVVMPAGENMFYVDQEASHALYGQFVGQELVALTRKMFPLSDRREDTFIAGLSMGGYGALRNGLKYSDTFGYIGGLSVANIVEGIEKRTNDTDGFLASRAYAESFFGDLDKVAKSDKNIKWIARKLHDDKKELPRLFIACGVDDSLLEINRDLRDTLRGYGFSVDYTEAPGAHEWDFWNTHIKEFIDWLPLQGTAGINSGNVGV